MDESLWNAMKPTGFKMATIYIYASFQTTRKPSTIGHRCSEINYHICFSNNSARFALGRLKFRNYV
jgi:hypothetical protein